MFMSGKLTLIYLCEGPGSIHLLAPLSDAIILLPLVSSGRKG